MGIRTSTLEELLDGVLPAGGEQLIGLINDGEPTLVLVTDLQRTFHLRNWLT